MPPAASGQVAAHRAHRRGTLSPAAHAAARTALELAGAAKHGHATPQGPPCACCDATCWKPRSRGTSGARWRPRSFWSSARGHAAPQDRVGGPGHSAGSRPRWADVPADGDDDDAVRDRTPPRAGVQACANTSALTADSSSQAVEEPDSIDLIPRTAKVTNAMDEVILMMAKPCVLYNVDPCATGFTSCTSEYASAYYASITDCSMWHDVRADVPVHGDFSVRASTPFCTTSISRLSWRCSKNELVVLPPMITPRAAPAPTPPRTPSAPWTTPRRLRCPWTMNLSCLTQASRRGSAFSRIVFGNLLWIVALG
ncbi:unnamed protein product [Prorocentrum cordatum]|uniref:Subtilisin n=1 Tax=Prorocentrum cordatum TaxID=2364126 RepID=A0ABN9Q8Q3_9DINO|nr:unnamed protein product [Polarella glacialis]